MSNYVFIDGHTLTLGYAVYHPKDIILKCVWCNKIFRQFDGGKLFEVFGQPTLKGDDNDTSTDI